MDIVFRAVKKTQVSPKVQMKSRMRENMNKEVRAARGAPTH